MYNKLFKKHTSNSFIFRCFRYSDPQCNVHFLQQQNSGSFQAVGSSNLRTIGSSNLQTVGSDDLEEVSDSGHLPRTPRSIEDSQVSFCTVLSRHSSMTSRDRGGSKISKFYGVTNQKLPCDCELSKI